MLAQLMREMLTTATFESFRVYSLDTVARLNEALELVEDVRRQRVPKAVLEPIAEELDWSFSKDLAAKALAADEVHSFLRTLKEKNPSLDSLTSHIRLVTKRIEPFYKQKIEQLLLDVIDDPQKRTDIRKLTGFYCSHLINVGYSRRHIVSVVNEFFLRYPVQRMGKATLRRFFSQFDGRQRKFIVHAAVSKDLGLYLAGLNFVVRDNAQLTPDQIATLSANANYSDTPKALEVRVDDWDAYRAQDFAYQILSGQRAIAYLDPYGIKFDWGERMHVTLFRAQNGIGIEKADLINKKPKVASSGHRYRRVVRYANSLISNFDDASTERLLSSIRTASLARTSLNPENNLISLWSAIEVLLSEPRDEARIVHYADLVCPCIALRHTRRQVFAIYDEILVSYRSKFNHVLRKHPAFPDVHGHRAFAEIMLLPHYGALRGEICGVLKDNPLALHRLWKLNRDYIDVKSAQNTLKDHIDRVRWQVHRIYRARNQLVHAGRTPSYLESIILNLSEYYRAAIATIVSRAKLENGRSDVDQVVAEIGIRYNIHRSKFQQRPNGDLTPDDVAILMDTA